jgi:hypothetical protein
VGARGNDHLFTARCDGTEISIPFGYHVEACREAVKRYQSASRIEEKSVFYRDPFYRDPGSHAMATILAIDLNIPDSIDVLKWILKQTLNNTDEFRKCMNR